MHRMAHEMVAQRSENWTTGRPRGRALLSFFFGLVSFAPLLCRNARHAASRPLFRACIHFTHAQCHWLRDHVRQYKESGGGRCRSAVQSMRRKMARSFFYFLFLLPIVARVRCVSCRAPTTKSCASGGIVTPHAFRVRNGRAGWVAWPPRGGLILRCFLCVRAHFFALCGHLLPPRSPCTGCRQAAVAGRIHHEQPPGVLSMWMQATRRAGWPSASEACTLASPHPTGLARGSLST